MTSSSLLNPSYLFWHLCATASDDLANAGPQLLALIQMEGFDPQFVFRGQSLAERVTLIQDNNPKGATLSVTRSGLMKALCEAGADPWRLPTTQQAQDWIEHQGEEEAEPMKNGLAPWAQAVKQRAWFVAEALLVQPGRKAREWSELIDLRFRTATPTGLPALYASLFEHAGHNPSYGHGLLDLGLPVNTRNSQGHTLLYHVKDARLLQRLLDLGADVTLQDERGRTPYAHQNEIGMSSEVREIWKHHKAPLVSDLSLLEVILKNRESSIAPLLPKQSDRLNVWVHVDALGRDVGYIDASSVGLLAGTPEQGTTGVLRRLKSYLKRSDTLPDSSRTLARIALIVRGEEKDRLDDVTPEQTRVALSDFFKLLVALKRPVSLHSSLWLELPEAHCKAAVAAWREHLSVHPFDGYGNISMKQVPLIVYTHNGQSIGGSSGGRVPLPDWESWQALDDGCGITVASLYLAAYNRLEVSSFDQERMEHMLEDQVVPFLAERLARTGETFPDALHNKAGKANTEYWRSLCGALEAQVRAHKAKMGTCQASPRRRRSIHS